MNLLQRLKAVFDSSKVQAASGRSMIVGGDAMRAPFDLRAGVKAYNSWIYAAANLNAVAVASTPLRLYIRKRSNRTKLWNTKEVSRATKAYLSGRARQMPSHCVMRKSASIGENFEEVVDSHPLLELLANVNPYQNGFDASVLRTLFGELTGNAFIHPVMDKRLGIPVELWTLPSQYVEIIPGKKSFIDGYMYGVDRQNRKRFEVDEVIHFKRPNPDDIYWGKGKVEAAFFAEQMNQAVHMMDLKFFQNNARPDSLVSIKGGASEADIRAFEAALSAKLEGSRNAGRFIVATAEIDIKPLSFPPKDLGGRDEIIEEIAAVFGVPVSMLKANDPNLASAKTGFSSWRETTILPLLRMDEEQLNQSLVPMFDLQGDAVLAYDNPVIEDEVIELQSRQAAVAGGWMTANEARMEEGREPMDDPAADQLMYGGRPLGFVAPPPPPPPPMAPMAPMASMPMNQDAIDTTSSDSMPVDQVEPIAPMIETPTKSARAKDCGTGAGGFQSGNTCGGGEGGGGGGDSGGGGGSSPSAAPAPKPAASAPKIPRTIGRLRDRIEGTPAETTREVAKIDRKVSAIRAGAAKIRAQQAAFERNEADPKTQAARTARISAAMDSIFGKDKPPAPKPAQAAVAATAKVDAGSKRIAKLQAALDKNNAKIAQMRIDFKAKFGKDLP